VALKIVAISPSVASSAHAVKVLECSHEHCVQQHSSSRCDVSSKIAPTLLWSLKIGLITLVFMRAKLIESAILDVLEHQGGTWNKQGLPYLLLPISTTITVTYSIWLPQLIKQTQTLLAILSSSLSRIQDILLLFTYTPCMLHNSSACPKISICLSRWDGLQQRLS